MSKAARNKRKRDSAILNTVRSKKDWERLVSDIRNPEKLNEEIKKIVNEPSSREQRIKLYGIKLIRDATPAEIAFGYILCDLGWRFTFQRTFVTPFHRIFDFYLHGKKAGIEIDGRIHKNKAVKQNDSEKDKAFYTVRGIPTIRFTNEQVLEDTERLKEALPIYIREAHAPRRTISPKEYHKRKFGPKKKNTGLARFSTNDGFCGPAFVKKDKKAVKWTQEEETMRNLKRMLMKGTLSQTEYDEKLTKLKTPEQGAAKRRSRSKKALIRVTL